MNAAQCYGNSTVNTVRTDQLSVSFSKLLPRLFSSVWIVSALSMAFTCCRCWMENATTGLYTTDRERERNEWGIREVQIFKEGRDCYVGGVKRWLSLARQRPPPPPPIELLINPKGLQALIAGASPEAMTRIIFSSVVTYSIIFV